MGHEVCVQWYSEVDAAASEGRARMRAEVVDEVGKKESGHGRTYDVVELRGSLPMSSQVLQTMFCSGGLCYERLANAESVEAASHCLLSAIRAGSWGSRG